MQLLSMSFTIRLQIVGTVTALFKKAKVSRLKSVSHPTVIAPCGAKLMEN